MQTDQQTALSNKISVQYNKDGYYAPVQILNSEEVQFYSNQLIHFLDKVSWKLDAINRHKPHTYLKWALDLGKHPEIIKNIQPILGPDILMWYSVIFVKPAQSGGYVPWHQDYAYWGMNEDEGVTAWVALSDVNLENGCVEVIPESHVTSEFKHVIDNKKENMLHRGQTLSGFSEEKTIPLILKSGECSFHHPKTLHMSKKNMSDKPRLGIAFRYIKTSNFPKTLKWLKRSATLASGVDKFSHFSKDIEPAFDWDPIALKAYRQSIRVAAVHTLFGDTSRSHWRKVIDTVPILLSRKTAEYFKYWKNLAE